MARTKRPKVSTAKGLHLKSKLNESETHNITKVEFLTKFRSEAKKKLDELEKMKKAHLDMIQEYMDCQRMLIPPKHRKMTIRELKRMAEELPTAYFDSTSIQNILNSTKKMLPITSTQRRSRSHCTDFDDGYLTADSLQSSNEASTGRQSRSRQKTNTSRRSRSLMKTTTQSAVKRSQFKTPMGRAPPIHEFGTVTPKVKPNTALVMLRHPKPGEMVISMQGSPILVNSIVTERCANVNIPLEDGNLMSLQPQLFTHKNLCDIPNLNPEIRSQLNTLARNLATVAEQIK